VRRGEEEEEKKEKEKCEKRKKTTKNKTTRTRRGKTRTEQRGTTTRRTNSRPEKEFGSFDGFRSGIDVVTDDRETVDEFLNRINFLKKEERRGRRRKRNRKEGELSKERANRKKAKERSAIVETKYEKNGVLTFGLHLAHSGLSQVFCRTRVVLGTTRGTELAVVDVVVVVVVD
jgi:hypothetical protein